MKILFLLILLFNINLFSQDDDDSFVKKSVLLRSLRLNFQANVLQSIVLSDLSGKHDYLLGNALSVGLEFTTKEKEVLNYCIGAMYQFPTSIEVIKGEMAVFPIYILIDYPLLQKEDFPIQLSLHFGYAFLSTKNGIEKVNNGIYHSLGFAMAISKGLLLKLMYAHNYGKIKIDTVDYNVRKENLCLSLNFSL